MRKIEKILIVVVTALTLISVHVYAVLYTPASKSGEPETVYIPPGIGFTVVANNLVAIGMLRDTEGFMLAAAVKGAYKKIKAGEYEFRPSMTPIEILESLIHGKVKQYVVTIPEGYNINDIAAAFEKAGLVDKDDFMARAADKKFVKSLGMDGQSLEGYLFPDTYIFTKPTTTETVMEKMSGRFKEVYDKNFKEAAAREGMKPKDVVTLASIIEKETGAQEEMLLVSAVFHNRLKRGIPLQSDPTVIYGIKNFDGNLTKKDLKTPSPYNTYLRYGLPPGPIANPGKAAIFAAINPADAGYLFFVSKNDGTHYFSKTISEHLRAVRTYQKPILSKTPKS